MAMLLADFLGTPIWMWLAFLTIVIALLALDLGVLHRKSQEISLRESLVMSAIYIGLGLGFGVWVWMQLGGEAGTQYLTAFTVEKALAMDNVFVIAMIFAYFAVPRAYQHRVLFWGIVGVIVLRAIMIGLVRDPDTQAAADQCRRRTRHLHPGPVQCASARRDRIRAAAGLIAKGLAGRRRRDGCRCVEKQPHAK